jgi:integrase
VRKPFWRAFNQHWYINIHGKQRRLSTEPDPDGGSRKDPPPHIENAWHRLTQMGDPKDMRLGELITRYLETIDPNADYWKNANFFLRSFQKSASRDLQLSKLIPLHLTDWLKRQAWKPSSRRTAVSRVHAAINWAVAQGILDKNPILSTPGYKREGHHERRRGIVPPDVAEALEAKAKPAFAAFLRGLRETGARPVELRRALIEKFDVEARTLTVPNKTVKKTCQAERTIILATGTVAFLLSLIGNRTKGHIFLTSRGKPWTVTNLEEYWKRTKKGCQWREGVAVPKGVSLYTYRHTFLSRAINETNVNPAIVAQLAGHTDLQMLMKHYLETDPEALRKAIESINAGNAQSPRREGTT